MTEEFGTGARLRAARHLAGFNSVEDLAKALGQRGLKTTVLREIETGRRRGDLRDLREVADRCRLPVEFFTADFSRLAEISEDPGKVIARRLRSVDARSGRQRDSTPADPPPPEGEDPPP
jgi:transcriptional regulator with XRE-family HTH domain